MERGNQLVEGAQDVQSRRGDARGDDAAVALLALALNELAALQAAEQARDVRVARAWIPRPNIKLTTTSPVPFQEENSHKREF